MGVVSNMPPPYTTGSVSGAAGGTVLTGVNTTWTVTDANGNTVGQVYPGDLVIIPGLAFPNPIQSVDSATQITLEIPIPIAVSSSTYRIRRYAPQPQGAVLGALQTVLAQGSDDKPDVSRTFDSGTGRLKIRQRAAGGMQFAVGPTGTADAQLVAALGIAPNGDVNVVGTSTLHDVYANNGYFRQSDGTGAVFLGDSSHYLYFDKVNYSLASAPLIVAKLTSYSDVVAYGSLAVSLNISCGDVHGANAYFADIHAFRTGEAAGTGAVYLGDNNHYLYYDGSKYNLNQGTLIVDGNVKGNAFIQNSDYRLKIESKPLEHATALLADVKVYEGELATELGVKRHYVFAHEAAETGPPGVVSGTKDAVDPDGVPIYQGVDYTRYVPALIAANQEQAKLIAQLTREVELITKRLPSR